MNLKHSVRQKPLAWQVITFDFDYKLHLLSLKQFKQIMLKMAIIHKIQTYIIVSSVCY